MADLALFNAAPVDIHFQTQENEVLDVQTPLGVNVAELEKFLGINVFRNETSNVDDELLSSDKNCLCTSTTSKSFPSSFGHLLRKFGKNTNSCYGCTKTQGGQILGPHEMPVQGTHVDARITPGFKYQVRILSQGRKDRYQFGGQALHLTRIGQGYGKRLTFEGEYANINPNYFWSDTHPNGYAFIISAVQPNDEFELCQQNQRPFGRATVVSVGQHQVEISSTVVGKSVVKRVIVAMRLSLQYTSEPHGMMSLRPDEVLDVMGVAVYTRSHGKSKAVTKCVEEVEIPGHGECLLYKEED